MKYYFLTLILAAVAVAGTGCKRVKYAQKEQTKQTNPESAAGWQTIAAPKAPETVTDDEPLLLDDEIGRASCRERV